MEVEAVRGISFEIREGELFGPVTTREPTLGDPNTAPVTDDGHVDLALEVA